MILFEDKTKNKQFLLTYCAFLINGMLALSIGSLLPFIRDARGLEYAFCGLIVSLHSVGNLMSSFLGGALPLWVGRKKSILFFEFFFGVSYLVILFTDNNLLLALAFFLTGFARGAASNYCNLKINSLAPGKAWIINGLHGMFAIGAFLFPIILMLITRNADGNWVYACGLMVAVGILVWVLYLLIPEESNVHGDSKQREDEGAGEDTVVAAGRKKPGTQRELEVQDRKRQGQFAFFKEPLFYLCIGTLFFYLCAEQGVIGWMITYFKDTGLLDPSLSQVTASVLWIMILAGRLTTAYLTTKLPKERLLPVMGAGLVGFFILLLMSRTTLWIMVGIMGFGYSMAGIYPTTVSFSGRLIEKYPLSWSFVLTTASLGSILMPSVIGRIAAKAGIFYGMSSIAAAIIVDILFILALVSYISRHKAETVERSK
ncbi:MAG: MFS transporter [Lachnospiraceae bacterium]|nr:MFS transporter [Lachnospiraceae bacterium]